MVNFGSIIAGELLDFSSDLLEVGIDPQRYVSKNRLRSSTIRSTVQHSQRLIQLLPTVVRELALDSVGNEMNFVSSRTPMRSVASRAPQDYALDGDRLVPTKWNQMQLSPERPEAALRWLAHVLQKQLSNHNHAQNRLQKYVGDAIESLRGVSEYAIDDVQELSQVLMESKSSLTQLRNAIFAISNAGPYRIKPSQSLPFPYPQEPSWRTLRRLSENITNPEIFIGSFINEVCSEPVLSADLPYLYQRWVALKLIKSLGRLDWSVQGDPVGAIWLGGKLEFQKDGKRVSMWIEPRLSHRNIGSHPSGYFVIGHSERTPDFLILAHCENGDEAFVLDATLSKKQKILTDKGKYLVDIESSSFRFIAGVPLSRFPLRSWAAAPISDLNCRIFDQLGCVGAIPMNPSAWNSNPLDAWVSDIENLI